jgi:glycosyltransferase involved in cell wall biosynthesis
LRNGSSSFDKRKGVPSISAVIVTLNEEINITRAILSVTPWVDEVIVVDMLSDDRTVEMARLLGAKVFSHPRVGFVEPARATAASYAGGEWIMILDADEMIPFPLSSELQRIAQSDEADVCRVPRLNYILGRPMIHGPHAPDRDLQVRFFKRNRLRFSDRIHSFPEPEAGARVCTVLFAGNRAIHHFHAATATQLIDKMNRYTSTDADQLFRQGKPAAAWRLVIFPPAFFLRGYFVDRGWRDGWRGLYWAFLMAFYRLTRETKHLQLFEAGSASNSTDPYSGKAEELLRAYNDSGPTETEPPFPPARPNTLSSPAGQSSQDSHLPRKAEPEGSHIHRQACRCDGSQGH